MDSIEKLRKYVHDNTDNSIELTSYPPQHVTRCTREKLLELIDAIEAEVKKCYMELPLGFDGEPIHVGDVLRKTFDGCDTDIEIAVSGVSEEYVYSWYNEDNEDEVFDLMGTVPYCAKRSKCFRHKDDPERILKDVLNGTCSLNRARERYAEVEKRERP